jgi:hypothetical protein
MNNLKIIRILLGLALFARLAYSMEMEMEERGKRKSPEIEESAEKQQASKKIKMEAFQTLINTFFAAISEGNLEKVNTILNSLPPEFQKKLVNYFEKSSGHWPLQLAWSAILAHKNQPNTKPIYFSIMKKLIEKGANINFTSPSGVQKSTILEQAVRNEDWDTVKFLLLSGADPDLIIRELSLGKIITSLLDIIDEKIQKHQSYLKYGGNPRNTPIKSAAKQKEINKKINDLEDAKKMIQYYIPLKSKQRAQELQRLYEPKQQEFLEPESLKSLGRH